MHFVALLKEQLGKIGAILAGDSSDKGFFQVSSLTRTMIALEPRLELCKNLLKQLF